MMTRFLSNTCILQLNFHMFDLEQPALNFTLNEGGEVSGGLNHLGIQVSSIEEVFKAKERLQQANLATFDEMNTNCCYARQDKIWVTSPDGHRWEVFTVHEDVERIVDVKNFKETSSSCCQL
jgi:hypothetical protein